MMALDPQDRYQTPAQLLEAIREVRRELESKARAGAEIKGAGYSVFVVEGDERLQDSLRAELKKLGFRVFLSADPMRARDRFRQQPYDALIVDARTTGDDGFLWVERVLKEAERMREPLAAVVILSAEQLAWKDKAEPRPGTAFLGPKVTMRQLLHALQDALRAAEDGQDRATAAE
jgi:DNA-binding response OmpR family regulator